MWEHCVVVLFCHFSLRSLKVYMIGIFITMNFSLLVVNIYRSRANLQNTSFRHSTLHPSSIKKNKPFSKDREDRLLSVSKKNSLWTLIKSDLDFVWNLCLTHCCLQVYKFYNLERWCSIRKQSIFILLFFSCSFRMISEMVPKIWFALGSCEELFLHLAKVWRTKAVLCTFIWVSIEAFTFASLWQTLNKLQLLSFILTPSNRINQLRFTPLMPYENVIVYHDA